MVVIGLTLAGTTALAEPLQLADTDLDLVTADVRNIVVFARYIDDIDGDRLDTDDTLIRILGDSDGDIGFLDARSGTDPESDDVDLAIRVSNGDPDNAVGDSHALIPRGDHVVGTGVVVFDRGTIAGNDTPAAATRTVSRQIVVGTGSTDNRGVVQTASSLTPTASSDSSKGGASGGGITTNSGPAQRIGGVERSLAVRSDNASGGASIRSTSLFAGNGSSGLSTSRLDRGINPGRFNASAFAGGAVSSMLKGSFN
jgi:hypothetical protein